MSEHGSGAPGKTFFVYLRRSASPTYSGPLGGGGINHPGASWGCQPPLNHTCTLSDPLGGSSGSDPRLKRKMYYSPGPPVKIDLSFPEIFEIKENQVLLRKNLGKMN